VNCIGSIEGSRNREVIESTIIIEVCDSISLLDVSYSQVCT
jgi:hypothetical protein